MSIGIKRTQRDYTLAFKLDVVEQVERGELTYKEAQHRYGIQARSTVLIWYVNTAILIGIICHHQILSELI